MGDQVGTSLSGTLEFVPLRELERIRAVAGDRYDRAKLFADACRLNALTMIARAGSGHIGSTFSSLDIVSWLHLEELEPKDASELPSLYFSSKGHDVPGLYAVLIGLGRLSFELLHKLRQLGGLPGHPDVGTPGIVTNTGSLGMGISKAKGMIFAHRSRGERRRIFVLTGDGELQEGQIWESLPSAVNCGLSELTVIVDHNKLQSDTFVERTSSLGDLEAKFQSFGWDVARVDGHDLAALAGAIERARGVQSRPQVIIADTIKGSGCSFMEHTSLDSDTALYRFHSGAPDADTYARAVDELRERLRLGAQRLRIEPIELERSERPALSLSSARVERAIPAYAEALLGQMERTLNLVALDADLLVDTGQLITKQRFPERQVECGIAEMDMVSMAGGMALRGLLPVCHSFASFLTSRANEQIFNNATEGTRIVYTVSLAGLLPAGPGHSHQSLRDIAVLASIPELTLIAPSSEREVSLALAWAVEENAQSSVIRLESMPCEVPFTLPENHRLHRGVGTLLRGGDDAVVFAYGPLLLSQAIRAAELLEARHHLSVAVVNLPWLNCVDVAFLAHAIGRRQHVFCLDNHSVRGGQGEMLASLVAAAGFARPPRVHTFGVEGLAACGNPNEVLSHHGLGAEELVERIRLGLTAEKR